MAAFFNTATMEHFIALYFLTILCIVGVMIRESKKKTLTTPAIAPPKKPKRKPNRRINAKLTLKSIIRWEQLRNKSFSLMDYSDKDDVDTLLYATTINALSEPYTFEVFRQTLVNEKIVRELVTTLESESKMLAQFNRKQSEESNPEESGNFPMIGTLISTLIMSGLDAHYVLNEMELCDIPMYIEACDRQKKEQMESSRLWTYLTILPHVDAKKLKSPRDLYTFPWEEDEIRSKAEQAMRDNEDSLKKFLSGELFDLNNVSWTNKEQQ